MKNDLPPTPPRDGSLPATVLTSMLACTAPVAASDTVNQK
jgi:hypothetical protein